ncbi:MAG TPA: NAD-dependent epimerase/dehydratase family protein [archaeon]|nr:NAD-dependent epimerase/dehydratase family protein [archaeon]
MKILVTGSSGLIGRNLVPNLRKLSHEVIEFNKSQGLDIADKEQVMKAVKGVNAVIHLAAELDESKPLQELMKVNVSGTEDLLEAASYEKVNKFIYLSSVAVYGSVKEKASEETPFNPETNYQKSKAEAEKKVQEFLELIPITVLRPAIVLGNNKFWQQIIKLIKKGFPLIGSGENHFQTIYVKDLVSAILFALQKEECEGETFNVAEETPLTLNEIYLTVREMLSMEKKVSHIPEWQGNILALINSITSKLTGKKSIINSSHIKRLDQERNYSIEKIKALGWKPKYSFKEGMKELLSEMNA